MAKEKPPKDQFADDWMYRIKEGITYRKKYSTRDQWDEYRNMYRGKWAQGIVPVNKMFSFGRMMVPRTYFRAPRVSVTPTRPDMIWHAKVVEAIDNQLIRQTFLKKTIKRSITDGFLCGIGPIKLGFDSEFGFIPEQTINEDGETVTQESRTHESEVIEYNQGVRPGTPWALRTRPEDVIVPWGSDEPDNLPWIAHYVLRPLDDVKQDQKYKHTNLLKGTRMSSEDMRKSPFRPRESKDKDVQFAELWEVRDVKTHQLMVFCENQLLLSVDDVLQVGGLPWEFINFNPDPEYFWSIPDASILYPQQKELNDTRTQTSRHRAIALLKFLYLKNAIKQEELAKLFSGEVGIGVAVEAELGNVAAAVHEMQPHIPPDLYKEAVVILNDMRESLGVSQNQEANFSAGSGKTATESMIVQQAYEGRSDERRDVVADVLCNIINKWNRYIFKLWTQNRVIQIVSPEGMPFWIQYTADQLLGEYYISVDIESGMPITRGLKYQMAQDLMKKYSGDPLINQILLRQIDLDNYSIIDPRAAQLLAAPPGVDPQMLAAARQPDPAHGGGGKGSGGGRSGSSPEKPMEFEQLKQQFAGRR